MQDRQRRERITFLVNPRAANSKWLRRKKLRAYLERKLPGKIHDLAGDARTTAERAREASATSEVIVAMGGDGTIADALQGIFDSGKNESVLFGVIPFGSGNAFRKSFGIPKNPRRAIDMLAAGVPRTIDLMDVDGRYAAFASVGATARVTAEKLDHTVEGVWGHAIAARRLFDSSREEKEIELFDGYDRHGPFERKVVRSNFFDCIIAKTNYFGYGWLVAPHARVDDGYLDITLFELSPLKYSFLFLLIYLGLYPGKKHHFKAKRVVIRGRDLPVQFNGEVLENRDVAEFRVLPKVIKMICPPGRRGARRFLHPD